MRQSVEYLKNSLILIVFGISLSMISMIGLIGCEEPAQCVVPNNSYGLPKGSLVDCNQILSFYSRNNSSPNITYKPMSVSKEGKKLFSEGDFDDAYLFQISGSDSNPIKKGATYEVVFSITGIIDNNEHSFVTMENTSVFRVAHDGYLYVGFEKTEDNTFSDFVAFIDKVGEGKDITFTVNAEYESVSLTNTFTVKTRIPKPNQNISIYTWRELKGIEYSSAHKYSFILASDITLPKNSTLGMPAEGWSPISVFKGTLDGKGYSIKDIFINRPEQDGVGIFSEIREGTVSNITLSIDTITGKNNVGGLVGNINVDTNITLENITITNMGDSKALIKSIESEIGGVVGKITGTSTTASTCALNNIVVGNNNLSVEIQGKDNVGGVVGSINDNQDQMSISMSAHMSGTTVVSNQNQGAVGGLIGTVNNSESLVLKGYVTGGVKGQSESSVGGLVGSIINVINSSTITGYVHNGGEFTISGGNDSKVGGLVGNVSQSDVVVQGYNNHDIRVGDSVNSSIGGVVGFAEENISITGYSTGNVGVEGGGAVNTNNLGWIIGNVANNKTLTLNGYWDFNLQEGTTSPLEDMGRGNNNNITVNGKSGEIKIYNLTVTNDSYNGLFDNFNTTTDWQVRANKPPHLKDSYFKNQPDMTIALGFSLTLNNIQNREINGGLLVDPQAFSITSNVIQDGEIYTPSFTITIETSFGKQNIDNTKMKFENVGEEVTGTTGGVITFGIVNGTRVINTYHEVDKGTELWIKISGHITPGNGGERYDISSEHPLEMNGTKSYDIYDEYDLSGIQYDLGGEYVLKNDIALDKLSVWMPIAGIFTGSLIGEGDTSMVLSKLTIQGTEAGEYGLFSIINSPKNPSISNITLQIGDGADDSGINVSGAETNVGALAGTIRQGIIQNVSVEKLPAQTSNSVINSGENTGGLVGRIEATGGIVHIRGGGIKETITMNTSAVSKNIGGLVGIIQGNNTVTIQGYSAVQIEEKEQVTTSRTIGGLIGQVSQAGTSNITGLYSHAGVISALQASEKSTIGGLVGSLTGRVTITGYNLGEITAQVGSGSRIGGIIGKTLTGVTLTFKGYNAGKIIHSKPVTDVIAGNIIGESSITQTLEGYWRYYQASEYTNGEKTKVGVDTGNIELVDRAIGSAATAFDNMTKAKKSDVKVVGGAYETGFATFDFTTTWKVTSNGFFPILMDEALYGTEGAIQASNIGPEITSYIIEDTAIRLRSLISSQIEIPTFINDKNGKILKDGETITVEFWDSGAATPLFKTLGVLELDNQPASNITTNQDIYSNNHIEVQNNGDAFRDEFFLNATHSTNIGLRFHIPSTHGANESITLSLAINTDIENADDFMGSALDVTRTYRVVSDITISPTQLTIPIFGGAFTGSLIGYDTTANQSTKRTITINPTDATPYIFDATNNNYFGIFSIIDSTSNPTIENITFHFNKTLNVVGEPDNKDYRVGAIAGRLEQGILRNVSTKGSVFAKHSIVGGLVGEIDVTAGETVEIHNDTTGTFDNAILIHDSTIYSVDSQESGNNRCGTTYGNIAGGVVGHISVTGGATVHIEGNAKKILIEGCGHAGGIVGSIKNTNVGKESVKIISYIDNDGEAIGIGDNAPLASITISGHSGGHNSTEGGTGGLVGSVQHSTVIGGIKNTTVSGATHIGGLAGNAQESNVHGYVKVDNGKVIKISSRLIGNSSYVGGLVGYATSTTGQDITGYVQVASGASKLSIIGNVLAFTNSAYVGGLVGYTAEKATVKGHVVGSGEQSQDAFEGANVFSQDDATVINVNKVGIKIISNGNSIGGLVGGAQKDITLEGYVNGNAIEIKGNTQIGGLIGAIQQTSNYDTKPPTSSVIGWVSGIVLDTSGGNAGALVGSVNINVPVAITGYAHSIAFTTSGTNSPIVGGLAGQVDKFSDVEGYSYNIFTHRATGHPINLGSIVGQYVFNEDFQSPTGDFPLKLSAKIKMTSDFSDPDYTILYRGNGKDIDPSYTTGLYNTNTDKVHIHYPGAEKLNVCLDGDDSDSCSDTENTISFTLTPDVWDTTDANFKIQVKPLKLKDTTYDIDGDGDTDGDHDHIFGSQENNKFANPF